MNACCVMATVSLVTAKVLRKCAGDNTGQHRTQHNLLPSKLGHRLALLSCLPAHAWRCFSLQSFCLLLLCMPTSGSEITTVHHRRLSTMSTTSTRRTNDQQPDVMTAAELRDRIDAQLARWARRSWWEVEQSKKVFVGGIERQIQQRRQEAESHCFGHARRREQLLEFAQVLEEQLPKLQSAPSAHG